MTTLVVEEGADMPWTDARELALVELFDTIDQLWKVRDADQRVLSIESVTRTQYEADAHLRSWARGRGIPCWTPAERADALLELRNIVAERIESALEKGDPIT